MDIFLRPLLAAGLALTLLPGCSGGTARSSLLHTPLGPDLQALWKAHGGLEKWGRFAGVSLDYQGTGVGALASAGKVSCKVIIDLEPPPSVTWNPEATEVAGEPQKELAASFLADLFHLPFALNQPGWKFRRAMVLPNTNTSSVEFEASRPTGANQTGPFFFRFSQIQDGLPSVHYFCRNALLGEGVYRVDFHDYKLIQGVPGGHHQETLFNFRIWKFSCCHQGGTFPPTA